MHVAHILIFPSISSTAKPKSVPKAKRSDVARACNLTSGSHVSKILREPDNPRHAEVKAVAERLGYRPGAVRGKRGGGNRNSQHLAGSASGRTGSTYLNTIATSDRPSNTIRRDEGSIQDNARRFGRNPFRSGGASVGQGVASETGERVGELE